MKKIIALFLFLFLITGCAQQTEINTSEPFALTAEGSSTVFPIIDATQNLLLEKYPTLNLTVSSSGSELGVRKLINEEIDFTYISQDLTVEDFELAAEKDVQLTSTPIGFDTVVVIVNHNNPIADLSSEELRKIFVTGEIAQWSQLTYGFDGAIYVYGSNRSNSGTSSYFFSELGGKPVSTYTTIEKSSDVITAVAQDDQGIGFISKAYLTEDVHELSINGVEPTRMNVFEGFYPFSRFLYLVTIGEPNQVLKEYIDILQSHDGKHIIEDLGYVSAN